MELEAFRSASGVVYYSIWKPVEQHLSRKTIHSRGEEVSRVTSEANSIRAIRDSAPPPFQSVIWAQASISQGNMGLITIQYEASVLGFRPWV